MSPTPKAEFARSSLVAAAVLLASSANGQVNRKANFGPNDIDFSLTASDNAVEKIAGFICRPMPDGFDYRAAHKYAGIPTDVVWSVMGSEPSGHDCIMNGLMLVGYDGFPADGQRLIAFLERKTGERPSDDRYSEIRQALQAIGVFANRTSSQAERHRAEAFLYNASFPQFWKGRVHEWESYPTLQFMTVNLTKLSIGCLAISDSEYVRTSLAKLLVVYAGSRRFEYAVTDALAYNAKVRDVGLEAIVNGD